MDPQDYDSDSSDASDLDYKPPGEEEKLSEIESDDLIEDDDATNTPVNKSKKTTKKLTKRKGKTSFKKKSKKTEIDDETVEKTKEEVNNLLHSSEEDKKRLDALWEEFQRPVPKKCSPSIPKLSETKSKTKESTQVSSKPETTKKRNFEELFDSSDSSKKVENSDNNITEPSSADPIKVITPSTVKRPQGGLANVLSQIGKKSKLTILEKSKQDWDGYKKEEGIVEELVTHNKGKDGYLEKRDFLERTDLRQFELEKAMRAANRSRRN